MEVWKAAVLGIVQGITEFLPVSSSGHLILFERILGAETGGADMFLGIMLHAGTLIAVLFAYAPRLREMLRHDRKKILYLIFGTIPAALVGVFLGDAVDRLFFGGDWLWLFFALTALLLLLCERRAKRVRVLRPLSVKNSLAVGCAQALAVIPGLSRSGTTFAAGVFAGLSREEAADFSFLMSIPVIAGAIAAELLFSEGIASGVSWQSLAVGTACAALCGFACLRRMQRLLREKGLRGFAVYLLILAGVLLAVQGFLR